MAYIPLVTVLHIVITGTKMGVICLCVCVNVGGVGGEYDFWIMYLIISIQYVPH